MFRALPFCLLLSLLLSACDSRDAGPGPAIAPGAIAGSEAPDDSQGADANAVFRAMLARHYRQDMEQFPGTASHRGTPTNERAWDPASNAFMDQRRMQVEARLEELRAVDAAALTEANRLSHRLYGLQLQRYLAADDFRHHHYIVHNFWGPHTDVPSFLINVHTVESAEDAENYIARLRAVKPLFRDVVERMRLAAENGIFLPDWAYPLVIETAANTISGRPFDDGPDAEDSVIYADIRGKIDALDAPKREKKRLLEEASAALLSGLQPGYGALIDEARRQRALAPARDGVWKHPQGKKFYGERLRYFTTLDMSAAEVHAIGLREVERIHGEMEAIRQQVGFEGDLKAFMTFMREDDQFYYANDEAGRARYLEEAGAIIDAMRERLPEAFGLFPKAEMVVKRVEAFREKSAGKAFYQYPPADGSRPGIYYANLYDMKSMPVYQMEALAYHEGIPGHHMQLAITIELEDIPEFQKYARFTAFTEGWGLYSEFLPKEMGFYEDPYSDFGRLAMELWRACRLVVDTGLHDLRWPKERAIRYLVDNTPNSAYDSTRAIERYAVMPGQATAYLIGKIKIVELREEARAALGDRFDIRGFHDETLKHGPVPLPLLAENIQRWTARQLAAAETAEQ